MATTLEDLLQRIEAAQRFSRDIDREIGLALGGWTVKGGSLIDHKGNSYVDHPGGEYPSFTEDLGLVLALADRLYPRDGRILTHTPSPTGSHNFMDIIAMPEDPEASATDPRGWGTHFAGKGATEALAACAALVVRVIGVPRR